MGLTLDDIDGKYQVKSEAADGSETYTVDGDGMTEIRNGLTYRKDKNGLIWESAFSVIDENHVQMESTVDPSHAPEGVYLSDEKGNPTSGMLTFKTVLDARQENGTLVLTGIITHGDEKTRLTLTKVQD